MFQLLYLHVVENAGTEVSRNRCKCIWKGFAKQLWLCSRENECCTWKIGACFILIALWTACSLEGSLLPRRKCFPRSKPWALDVYAVCAGLRLWNNNTIFSRFFSGTAHAALIIGAASQSMMLNADISFRKKPIWFCSKHTVGMENSFHCWHTVIHQSINSM